MFNFKIFDNYTKYVCMKLDKGKQGATLTDAFKKLNMKSESK